MRFLSSTARRAHALLALGLLAPLLAAVPAHAAVAEGVVVGAGSADAIAGRYLVVLRDTPGLGATAQGLVGDRVTRTFAALNAFSARLSAQDARRLAANPSVRFVEQDRQVHVDTMTQRRPAWNLDRIDQRPVTPSRTYTPTDDGSAVHAYVIDTGIRISHEEFGGRASYGYDFVGGDPVAADCNGHGTHVAGTIGGATFGVAKKVKLVAVRVLNCKGFGDLEGVVDGVNWVTQHAIKPAVANMSLGSGHSSVLDYAVARSIASGVTYAVAAGNENRNAASSSPADVSTAITVGATDSRDRRASFSNYGAVVDLFAPGVNVWSSYDLGDTIIARMSGTSMASPHVAGAAALVLDAHPAWSPRTVRNYLVEHATTGKVAHRGAKSPNRLLFVPPPPKPVVIRTTTLPAGTAGVAYSSRLTLVSGRLGAWRVVSGSLPPGLTLSPAGLLSGTPSAPGTWHVTVGFTDYVPTRVTRALTVTVHPSVPVISAAALPGGTANSPYSAQLAAADGRGGTWTLTGGTVPAGLALSASGALTGTPLAAGSFSLDVQFTDAWNQTTAATLALTVAAGTPDGLPDAVTGVAYDQSLPVAAGLPGGTWSVSGGVLPAGLALSAGGEITGVPAGPETQVVRFSVVTGGVTRVAEYVLTVD